MSSARRVKEPPEQVEEFTVRIPNPAMQQLRQMAAYLDISCDALLRRYLSRGLRADQAAFFSEQALPAIEESLRAEFGDDPRLEKALAAATARLDRGSLPRFRSAAGPDEPAPRSARH